MANAAAGCWRGHPIEGNRSPTGMCRPCAKINRLLRIARGGAVHLSLLERLMAHTEKTETCWLWTANRSRNGYGRVRVSRRDLQAHRVAYELLVGPIPDGLELDHLCRNRACVNPAHLEPVTHLENTLRSVRTHDPGTTNRAKTHCPQGHPYSGANLFARAATDKNGPGRVCRECGRIKARAAYRRRRDAA